MDIQAMIDQIRKSLRNVTLHCRGAAYAEAYEEAEDLERQLQQLKTALNERQFHLSR